MNLALIIVLAIAISSFVCALQWVLFKLIIYKYFYCKFIEVNPVKVTEIERIKQYPLMTVLILSVLAVFAFWYSLDVYDLLIIGFVYLVFYVTYVFFINSIKRLIL